MGAHLFLSLLILYHILIPTSIGEKSLDLQLEIADSPAERTQGLSDRVSLPDDSGMLFIFDEPGYYSFWMKNMNFPLDIIWLDENWRVVWIDENILPETYPALFNPPSPIKFVLEINTGKARELELRLGERVSLPATIPELDSGQ
ncbi:MAG TPA: DUF192 domain-containing protein [Candidatus Paceibacterota bacterium]